MPSAFSFFLAISLAGFFIDMTMGSAWALCQDIGRRYAAIVAGCMNMCSGVGNALANLVTGFILQQIPGDRMPTGLGLGVDQMTAGQKAAAELAGYHLNFFIFAGMFVVGVICWLLVDATKPVVPEEQLHAGQGEC